MLVKGGRVISTGYNRYTNHPDLLPEDFISTDFLQNYISIHAEIDAIKGIDPDIVRGSTIYVARVTRGGAPGLSRPCQQCAKALVDAGVRKVVYTDSGFQPTCDLKS